jgi:hypothetical protein
MHQQHQHRPEHGLPAWHPRQLPAPPPEMAAPVYSTEVPTEPAQDAEEEANPLR